MTISTYTEKVRFIENKIPDMARIGSLLDICREQNQWANRGPLYRLLADQYSEYFNLPSNQEITPCANGGIALETIARVLAGRAGRALRWVASAFSFANLGRGYFSDVQFVDCDATGMIDLKEVRMLEPDSYDGLVVVNAFGLARDFSAYADFALKTGKELIIDNAAGIDRRIPDWPWQSFSLHHTKPFGVGEGGLALTPTDAAEEFYALLDYGDCPADKRLWVNNGKLSDIACAFHIDRLERSGFWLPQYLEQAARVERIALEAGFSPLSANTNASPTMSKPFLGPCPIPLSRIRKSKRLTFGKYYKPLADLPQATSLYAVLLNIPTHPDVSSISDLSISGSLTSLCK